jgi:4-hydroxy-2-oxoheptanedioate aldolase
MPALKKNWLKPKLASQPYVLGTFVELPSPQIVEILGLAGFDFIVIDGEHGAIPLDKMEEMVRAAAGTGICPLVRVPQPDSVSVRLPLDLGAVGVHVPQIESTQLAETALRGARFYPQGERGMQPYVRAASYRAYPTSEYLAESNREVTTVLHIEGRGGLDAIDRILELDGVDVAFVGPYDLSQALGIPGQVDDPRIGAAIREVVQKAGDRVVVGTYADTADRALEWIAAGVRYLTVSCDAGILRSAAAGVVNSVRSKLGG